MPDSLYIPIPELAQRLEISPGAVYDRIKAGLIPAERVGKTGRRVQVLRSRFEAYLAGQREQPTPAPLDLVGALRQVFGESITLEVTIRLKPAEPATIARLRRV